MSQSYPVLVSRNPFRRIGNWYVGLPEEETEKPPLLFVHGLHSSSKKWFKNTNQSGHNDMYQLAKRAGYPTAFVDLNTDQESIWENGKILSQRIKEIYHFFGNKKINIIGHSKGGVDAQTALIFYQSYEYVDRLITLGTPHYGSPLADLAFSDKGRHLAKLLAYNDLGTYQMQTGYMQKMREKIDVMAKKKPIAYYTIYGVDATNHLSSYLHWSGKYLSQYGANDGVVLVKDAGLPYSTHISGHWNHDNIRLGKNIFPFIDSIVNTHKKINPIKLEQRKQEWILYPLLLHGGQLRGNQETFQFYVPKYEKGIDIQGLSSSAQVEIELVMPNQQKIRMRSEGIQMDDLFDGAYLYQFSLSNPKSGAYQIHIKGNRREAFFIMVSLDSFQHEAIHIRQENLCDSVSTLQIQFQPPDYWQKDSLMIHINGGQNQLTPRINHSMINAEWRLPNVKSIANLRVHLSMKTKYGEKIERDYVKSFVHSKYKL
ncbi:MAG: esterase/lipase family protein [Tepidibacillus sp.]